MLKSILVGVGILIAIAAAGLAWAYSYYIAYDPPYKGAELGTLIEVHPEIHGGWDTGFRGHHHPDRRSLG
jgi:hypothetical protein